MTGYQMRRRNVTLQIKYARRSDLPVPAGDRHPFGFAFHAVANLAGESVVETDSAAVVAAPNNRCQAFERPNDNEHVIARSRHIAGIQASAFGGEVRDDD